MIREAEADYGGYFDSGQGLERQGRVRSSQSRGTEGILSKECDADRDVEEIDQCESVINVSNEYSN